MEKIISGIQQVGIGIGDARGAFKWYREAFGMDVCLCDDFACAKFMGRYTGGKLRERHAILAFNMQGGGGMEIWQYTNGRPRESSFRVSMGDYGIFAVKIKTKDVQATREYFGKRDFKILNGVEKNPSGVAHFFIKDPYNNLFQIMTGNDWFKREKHLTGGIMGCMIGVSDIEKSRKVYSDILGYDDVVYDTTGVFEDLSCLPGGAEQVRRVLLRHSKPREGNFCRLLGSSEIELVQTKKVAAKKIYHERHWGDLGFIHLCFDVINMNALRNECSQKGFPFTVDSENSYAMGSAAGHFSYIEDPDGTLIEFVETHRIPILKKLGIYINLKRKKSGKALPDWMVKSLSFRKVRK